MRNDGTGPFTNNIDMFGYWWYPIYPEDLYSMRIRRVGLRVLGLQADLEEDHPVLTTRDQRGSFPLI